MSRSEPGPTHVEPPAWVTYPAGQVYEKPGGLLERMAPTHIPPMISQAFGAGGRASRGASASASAALSAPTPRSAGDTRFPQPSDESKSIDNTTDRPCMALRRMMASGAHRQCAGGRLLDGERWSNLSSVGWLCIAVFVLATLGIPLAFMWPYVRDEEVYWPGYTLIERSTVSVGEGAFRDARADVERERAIDAGMPKTLKIASFLVMYAGQFWPILALYAALSMIGAVVMFFESGLLVGGMTAMLAGGMLSWTLGARSGWNAAIHVLRGDRKTAETSLRTSVFCYGLTLFAAVLVAVLAAASNRDPTVLALSSPFFLLAALAFAHESLFAKHAMKLPDAVGHAFVDPKTGFVLSGVRVQNVMDPASSAAHEEGLHAVSSDKKQA